jgi:hypothetical protein
MIEALIGIEPMMKVLQFSPTVCAALGLFASPFRV